MKKDKIFKDELDARKYTKYHICAICHSHLSYYNSNLDGKYHIFCIGNGVHDKFILEKTYELMKKESFFDKLEVESMLKDLGIIEKNEKSIEQQIKELGF
jgi:alcohol dehydrogenase YqhD (iron-dependent ADH family)